MSPSVVALLLVFVFMTSAFQVSAVDRVGGQFWTYDASMTVAGLNATGTVTYSLSGRDSVMASGVSYDADILTISGNLSASSTLFGAPYSVSTVLGGARYESRGGMSTIREDLLQWTNISIGSAPVQLLARMQTEITTTYTPPYLSKFDPATTSPGDTWTEGITLNTTTIVNGTTVQGISRLVTYNVVVASSMEEVTVDAGTFQTLKITTTDSIGARNMFWWSSKVQNFVVEKRYDALNSQPSTILSLKEFDSSAGAGTLIAVIVGVVVVAVAIVILAAILSARRPREPVHPLPPQAGVLGPSRMPPPTPPGVKAPGLIEKQPRH
jgi:hypothetical protein